MASLTFQFKQWAEFCNSNKLNAAIWGFYIYIKNCINTYQQDAKIQKGGKNNSNCMILLNLGIILGLSI